MPRNPLTSSRSGTIRIMSWVIITCALGSHSQWCPVLLVGIFYREQPNVQEASGMLLPAFLDYVTGLLEGRGGRVEFLLAFRDVLAVLQMQVRYLLRAEQMPNAKGPTQ